MKKIKLKHLRKNNYLKRIKKKNKVISLAKDIIRKIDI